jgi:peroxiredoxin
MPSVQRVHETFKDKEVVVLAISIDGDGEKSVKPYITKQAFTFLTTIDPRMEVARKFGVRGVPTTYIVNREGAIVAHGFGPGIDFDSSEFLQYIQTLLAQSRS